jgi:hypothetical protein
MQLEKFVWTGVAIGVALCIGTAPISAKPGSVKPSSPKMMAQGGPKSPAAPKTTHVSSPKTTTHGQSGATHGPKTTTTSKGPMSAGAQTKTHGNPHGTTSTSTTTTTTTGTTTTTTGTSTDVAPLTKSQQLLTKNTNLQSKMQTRLGSQLPDGVTVIQAASGFKNLGQFVAAVNVSNNLGIPFADLKAKMTGMTVDGQPVTTTTGGTTTNLSLGQAIQSLKGVDSTTATQTANTATTQANTEISSTTTTTTSTTTTTTKAKKRH